MPHEHAAATISSGPVAGHQQQRDADEAHGDAGERAPGDAVAPQGAVQDDPQRGGGDQERGQPRRHVLLGHGDEPVAARGQEDADERQRGQRAPLDTHALEAAARSQQRERQQAGGDEAHAGAEQRRHRLDHHADGQVRRAPDDVDDAEGRPHPPRRRGADGRGASGEGQAVGLLLGGGGPSAHAQELDGVGGPDEGIGDDAAVGQVERRDGAAVLLGDERPAPQGPRGVEGGEAPEGDLVGGTLRAEDQVVQTGVHGGLRTWGGERCARVFNDGQASIVRRADN
jgi:hypothetical protein